jgi:hypothetical protein
VGSNPNRLKRLRDFRDEALAHELWRETPREAPQYDDLWALVDEAKACIADVELIVEGADIGWGGVDVRKSAQWLWDTVAAASP